MEGGELMDYLAVDTLLAYEETAENFPTAKNVTMYNAELLMPGVKGKVVLDLPCGIGIYVRKFFKLGAAKVIASDIVSRQLEMSRERDKKIGIPEGLVEYYQHDAKVPKQLSNDLADVCSAIHLFCFAKNEGDVRGMVRTLLANLKPGGRCLIITCSLCGSYDEQKIRKEFEKFEEQLVHLDPPSSEKFKPRRVHTSLKGFQYNRFTWRPEVLCDVMQEEGFSKTELVPFKVDPSYEGDMDLQAYIDLCNLKAILALK